MHKKSVRWTAALCAAGLMLAGCGPVAGDSGTEKIRLMVWSPSEDQSKDSGQWLQTCCENFAALHPEASADVFMYANDTLTTMTDANALAKFGGIYMDGFRFDLMGLLDTGLMQRIRAALDARYGRGEKLVFGEPWAAGPTACKRGTRLADKKSLPALDPEIGAFCDAVRDAVKGSVQHTRSAGFVNGGRGKEGAVAHSLTAWCPGGRGFHTAAPTQTITYVSCHDDVTLWDKLVDTLDPRRRYDEGTPRVLRVETPAPRCVTALLDNTGGRWGQLYLVYNASGQAYTCTPDGEDWQCLADGKTTFGWQQSQTAPTFTAAPGTALILGKPSQL